MDRRHAGCQLPDNREKYHVLKADGKGKEEGGAKKKVQDVPVVVDWVAKVESKAGLAAFDVHMADKTYIAGG